LIQKGHQDHFSWRHCLMRVGMVFFSSSDLVLPQLEELASTLK
jgi:hypothetical protein